ncbi:MAG: hypothetical protein AAF657_01195 [Acidobacteriota bacterium]
MSRGSALVAGLSWWMLLVAAVSTGGSSAAGAQSAAEEQSATVPVATSPTLDSSLIGGTAAAEHGLLESDRAAIVDMRTAALIMSGQQGGALPVALAVLPQVESPDQLTVLVEVDGAALVAQEAGAEPWRVDVHAYVLEGGFDVVEQQSLAFDLDPQRHGLLLAGTGLKIFLPLEIPTDDSLLRVLVRSGDDFGLRGLELAGEEGGASRILQPIFSERDEPWLLAKPAGRVVTLPPPFAVAARAAVPTVRPVAPVDAAVSGLVFVRGEPQAGAELTALHRRPGEEAIRTPIKLGERTETPGLQTIAVVLPTEKLEPGVHEIVVGLAGAESAGVPAPSVLSPPVTLFIEAPKRPILGAVDEGDRVRSAGAPDSELPKAQKKLLREARRAYRQALQYLVEDQRQIALATLQTAQTRVWKSLDADAIAVLDRAESGVLARLDPEDWSGALPVALLYLELGQTYRQEHRFILASYSAQKVVQIAEAHARLAASQDAVGEAAQLIASLGSYSQLDGARSQAKRYYAAALEVSGEDPAALFGLATIYEKEGRFNEALPFFKRFVEAHPEHLEGRLRLAINQARGAKPASARRSLEKLGAQREAEWIALLAHQELARLEISQDRSRQAAGVLRRALERWPAHPTLTIQQAYVLDAQGSLSASRTLLESLQSSTAAYAANERFRYNTWPADYLRALRRDLFELADARLADLRRWLADLPAVGEG